MTAFLDEERVSAGGESLTLAIDFRAIDQIEHSAGQSMPDVVKQLFADTPQRSVLGKALWALLQRRHPEIGPEQASSLIFTPDAVSIVVGIRSLIIRALNFGKAKGENPPKRRGALKPS